MPFTFSHPAIVLPFLKNKNVSSTALIVGAMSPDFEYFFRMKVQSEISHTLLGIFLIDFPLGFIVIFVFHTIIKKPLITNLPRFFQVRMQLLKDSNWLQYFKNNILVVLLSFFLGTLSHIFWDSMTHWDGYVVERIPFFNEDVFGVSVYKIAQHLSSIIGLVCIVIYMYKLPVVSLDCLKINWNYWFCSLFFGIVLIGFRFYFGTELGKIGNAIVSILFSMMMALSISGIIFRNKKFI